MYACMHACMYILILSIISCMCICLDIQYLLGYVRGMLCEYWLRLMVQYGSVYHFKRILAGYLWWLNT